MTNLKKIELDAKNRWKPPNIRDAESEGHASWVELFFDLVFVVVIAELSHYLSEHLTVIGFLQFAILFVPCWWSWVLFTFYSDRYETDDVIHRLLVLSAMLAVIFLAANIHDAFSDGAIGFVLAYVTLRSIVLALYARVARHVDVACNQEPQIVSLLIYPQYHPLVNFHQYTCTNSVYSLGSSNFNRTPDANSRVAVARWHTSTSLALARALWFINTNCNW